MRNQLKNIADYIGDHFADNQVFVFVFFFLLLMLFSFLKSSMPVISAADNILNFFH